MFVILLLVIHESVMLGKNLGNIFNGKYRKPFRKGETWRERRGGRVTCVILAVQYAGKCVSDSHNDRGTSDGKLSGVFLIQTMISQSPI